MRKKRDLTTDKIIKQAAKLLEKEGQHGLSLHKLARSLNIKTPSLYNHISNYDDLMEELSIYGMHRLKSKWEKEDLTLEELMDTFLEFAKTNPELHKITQSPPIKVSAKWNREADSVAAIAIKVISTFAKTEAEVVHKVRFLRSFLVGFAELVIEEGFQKEQSLSQTYLLSKKQVIKVIKRPWS